MKNSPPCAHVLQKNLEFGHFTLLLLLFFAHNGKEMYQKYKTHVQVHCFCSLSLLFCGVPVAVAVAVVFAKAPLIKVFTLRKIGINLKSIKCLFYSIFTFTCWILSTAF